LYYAPVGSPRISFINVFIHKTISSFGTQRSWVRIPSPRR
jgi:hypothetical protein